MNVVIVANGAVNDYGFLQRELSKYPYKIACDGGLRHFNAVGITPDILIGDMDSVPHLNDNIPILRYPREKDQTDLELALAHAFERIKNTPDPAVTVLGALGGRVDHMLANIFLLHHDIPTKMKDETTVIQFVRSVCALNRADGGMVSLIPVNTASGITTSGLIYPLKNETLVFGETRGISNVLTGETATVTLSAGSLLVVQTS
jgi:thiamine pyrophosphokinase